MRILVYEYLTALGLGCDPGDPMHSMYREGRAMRDALAADLAAIPGCVATFDEAEERDGAIVIAPETDGVLLQLAHRFEKHWLGCSPAAIALTTDKLALANHWRANGVRTPATTDREPTRCEAFPVVWKPRDGCGSTDTYLLKDAFDLAKAKATVGWVERCEAPEAHREPARWASHAAHASTHPTPMILQEYISGLAVSLAFLCGPSGNVALIPAFQHLSTDGRFHYQGGELPIPSDLAERAIALGSRALNCVPGLRGFIGVDMVLGESADYAIEINPRLTTSYVGLRALAKFNIAEAMVSGRVDRAMAWKPDRVRFAPDGSVSPAGPV